MRTIYFDARCGAAGDMVTGALLGLVPDAQSSIDRLNSMGLESVTFAAEKTIRGGIAGCRVEVSVHGETEGEHCVRHGHHGHHHHHHHHATMEETGRIVDSLKVSDSVKEHVLAVYRLIADAEARAHGVDVAEVHFHEVGMMDAIADIAAAALLIEELAPERILSSFPEVGGGFVRCMHGTIPVPAPATVNILKGVTFTSGAAETELLTPTGAAVLVHFAEAFRAMPPMAVERTGTGCGTRELEGRPNILRAFLGDASSDTLSNGRIAELTADIDDMTGEDLAFACERLREAGAVDVTLSSVIMKKGRPGSRLTVLARMEDADALAGAILRGTSTFGVRRADKTRYELERVIETGSDGIRVKTGRGYGVVKSKKEFEDRAEKSFAT